MVKKVTWDIDNLNKNEKEKTPKTKIEEPPTPYIRTIYQGETSEEVSDTEFISQDQEDDEWSDE